MVRAPVGRAMTGDLRVLVLVFVAGAPFAACDPSAGASSYGASDPSPSASGTNDARDVTQHPPPAVFIDAQRLPPAPPFSEPSCDYLILSAKVIGDKLGEPVEFLRFLHDDIVGRFGSGENFLQMLPPERFSDSSGLVRMPPDARDLRIRDTHGSHVLGCSLTECALLELDPANRGYFHRLRGGTVPGGTAWNELYIDTFRLCVRDPDAAVLCFDRIDWARADGEIVTSGRDAGPNRDASIDARVDASASVGDASAPSIEAAPCEAPIYCSDPELANDPLCYHSGHGFYFQGVTVSGRMIRGNLTDGGVAECSASPPFGNPIGLATSGCGLSSHVVMLTVDGLYETCGCVID